LLEISIARVPRPRSYLRQQGVYRRSWPVELRLHPGGDAVSIFLRSTPPGGIRISEVLLAGKKYTPRSWHVELYSGGHALRWVLYSTVRRSAPAEFSWREILSDSKKYTVQRAQLFYTLLVWLCFKWAEKV
jgi:hypothetical protein